VTPATAGSAESTGWRHRAVDALCWLGPVVFLLWLYADGLNCWFIADDFAWLGLLRQVHSAKDVVDLMLVPAAQGTIRPWSERGFFLVFESLFGLDALPFRIMVFATMAADVTLLQWITRRLTGSRLAGVVAAVCWVSNAALTTVMSWSSSYNEVLCPFFLLASLALLIRYAETGRRSFWWWQLVVFTLGFGALEVNVVYPALAAAYALFAAPQAMRRKLLIGTAPLFAISIAYFLLHKAAVPLPASGVYALHLDARIFRTLALYGKWSLLPSAWRDLGYSRRLGDIILWAGILALAGLAVAEFRKRRPVILFFASWFLITLGPVLPLWDHHSDYYLTIPLIGLGMLAGWAVARGGAVVRAGAAIAVLLYLGGMIPAARAATHWWLERTIPVRGLVLGVEAARDSHPGKVILLDGITSELYDSAVGQAAFLPLGITDVYLTPQSELSIQSARGAGDVGDLVVDPAAIIHAAAADQIVVYSVAGDHLRNITREYERLAPSRFSDRLPSHVDLGNPLYSWLLGPEWLPSQDGRRWMPSRATLQMQGPHSGNKLSVDGYCPEEQLKEAPRHLIISADGIPVGETQINDPESSFHRLFAVPAALAGRDSVRVELRVDPAARIGGQDYGLVFGNIAFR
jgi:4-amino-4-deoxy-L-arabinose transferase-like glycosyltransferase